MGTGHIKYRGAGLFDCGYCNLPSLAILAIMRITGHVPVMPSNEPQSPIPSGQADLMIERQGTSLYLSITDSQGQLALFN